MATMVRIRPSAPMNKQATITKIQNIPLVKAVSINGPVTPGSVFFGVGLITSKQLGTALPFDLLGMFFTAELLRKELNLKTAVVVLADRHAESNHLFSKEEIQVAADRTEAQLNKIVHNFALHHFRILRASVFHSDPGFQKILNTLPGLNNEYLRLETADCLWLKQTLNLTFKVGWTMSKTNRVEGNDERFFDTAVSKFIPCLNLVHLEPGWTFDLSRPRVPPYIAISGENRLLLTGSQAIPPLGICAPHLAKIVRCAEILWGKLPFVSLEEKVQFLLNKAVA